MAGPLQTLGPSLIAAGYSIVPVHTGSKRPIGNNWSENPVTLDSVKKFNGAGIGLLAGVGEIPLCIIDIDCSWAPGAEMAEKMASEMLGFCLQRIGQYPKQSLVYRAFDEGWPKAFSKKFKHPDHLRKMTRTSISDAFEEKDDAIQIEVLGKGQQSVAYGIHPVTEKEYYWEDILGGIAFADPSELSTVRLEQVKVFIQSWEDWMLAQKSISLAVAAKKKLIPTMDDLPFITSDRLGIPFIASTVKSQLLAFDPADRLEWMNVGWALHHEFEGSEKALTAWIEWSRTWHDWIEDRDFEQCRYQWAHMRSDREKPRTWRSIIDQPKKMLDIAPEEGLAAFRQKVLQAESAVDLMGPVCEYGSRSLSDNAAVRAMAVAAIQARLTDLPESAGISKTDILKALKKKTGKAEMKGTAVTQTDMDFLNGWSAKTPECLGGWAWTACNERFINTLNGREYKKDGFDGLFMQHAIAREFSSPSLWVHTTQCIPHAEGCLYLPGRNALFIESGIKFVNSWSRKDYVDIPENLDDKIDEAAAGLLEKHVSLFFGGLNREAILFVNFLRYCVEMPGKKIRWAPLLVGPEGDGKSFFADLMKLALGHANVGTISNSALRAAADSGFNSFMARYQIVFLEEVKMHGHNKYDIFNTLKEPITNNGIGITLKGKETIQVPNVTNWILTSNHKSCMPLSLSDRRYFVLWSKFPLSWVLANDTHYFDRLFSALEESPGGMMNWVCSVPWHDEFQPNGRAPITDARMNMISMSRDEKEDALKCVIGASKSWAVQPDVLLSGRYLTELLAMEDIIMPDYSVSRSLENIGYTKLGYAKLEGTPIQGTLWVNSMDVNRKTALETLEKRYVEQLKEAG